MILELKNIDKSFGAKEVLKGVSFTAEGGKAFGLLGRNGAGKTTSIRILMDVFPADKGQILIDGQDIKHVTLNSLRSQMGIMLQDSFLFSGTIADNITMFESIDAKKLAKVIKMCGLDDIVNSLKHKENHFLVESGKNLPSQIRQKIAIARKENLGANQGARETG